MKKMREYLLTVAQLLCSELGGSPDKAASGGMAEALFGSHDADDAGDSAKTAKEMSFPDSWMEQPGDAPFMFSFEADDLTGNKASFCIQGPGAEWATPFSLESIPELFQDHRLRRFCSTFIGERKCQCLS